MKAALSSAPDIIKERRQKIINFNASSNFDAWLHRYDRFYSCESTDNLAPCSHNHTHICQAHSSNRKYQSKEPELNSCNIQRQERQLQVQNI
jgi:hypothetical protein